MTRKYRFGSIRGSGPAHDEKIPLRVDTRVGPRMTKKPLRVDTRVGARA
jgi:hypothetical protein